MRFHSVAEFSSYCTSDLSLSHNASDTKYSTRGVSLPWYPYKQIKQSKTKKKSKKRKDHGGKWGPGGGGGGVALLSGCSDFTAQPKLRGREKKKGNQNQKRRSSPDIHKGSTHTDVCDKRLLRFFFFFFQKRNNIYKPGFWKPSPRGCCEVLPSAGWGSGLPPRVGGWEGGGGQTRGERGGEVE